MKLFTAQKKLAVVVLLLSLMALFYHLDLQRHFTLFALKTNFAVLSGYYAKHPVVTVAIFISLFAVLSALALPGPHILCLAAGALFGVTAGTLYVTSAATAGASLAFLATRYLFRERIQKLFGKHLIKVNTVLAQEGFLQLLLIRLIPVAPFTLINIGAALSKMTVRTFIAGTFLGIIPLGLIFCNAGAHLAEIENIGDILTFKVAGSILLLGIFPLLAICHRRLLRKKGKKV
ncbi:MAG: DedA family protein [Deltaproteobacteria bacterium]|nr:DedA family protein [Deltaproteobacteria bacterium]